MSVWIELREGTELTLQSFEPGTPNASIVVKSKVDQGSSADIFTGMLTGPDPVNSPILALKVFPFVSTPVALELRRRELEVVRKLSHPNVLSYLGVCNYDPHTILVSPYMENGNLFDYLKRNTEADRDLLVIQVSRALAFLHNEARIVHGDLKCQNVLVSDSGGALLADFGLSTTVEKAPSEKTTGTGIRNLYTLRFCAPEILDPPDDTPAPHEPRTRSKTPASDIYAFGMLLLQAYTREMPWAGIDNELGVIKRVAAREIPSQPESTIIDDLLWLICKQCWQFEPSSRPVIQDLVDILELHRDIKTSTGIPQILPAHDSYTLAGFTRALRLAQQKDRPVAIDPDFGPGIRLILRRFDPKLPDQDIISGTQFHTNGLNHLYTGRLIQPEHENFATLMLTVFPRVSPGSTTIKNELVRRGLAIVRKLHQMHHPNILPFLGTSEFEQQTILVSQYMANGNLFDYLGAHPGADIDLLVLQVSRALDFLHNKVMIVHDDLKCENVLVSDSGVALLAGFDFSTSVEKAESEPTTVTDIRHVYTLWFCAPEALMGDEHHSHGSQRSKIPESDIYSFGMLLLQAYTGLAPWAEHSLITVVMRLVQPESFKPSRPTVMNNALWSICTACWTAKPSSRPRIQNIVYSLELLWLVKTCRGENTELPEPQDNLSGLIQRLEALLTNKNEEIFYPTSQVKPVLTRVRQCDDRLAELLEELIVPAQVHNPLKHPDAVHCVAHVPDGRIVSGCEDGAVRVWDFSTGKVVGAPMTGHTRGVLCVAVSGDGAKIASGSVDKTVRVWDAATRAMLALIKEHSKPVRSLALSHDGKHVMSGCDDGMIRVWDVASVKIVVGPIKGHTRETTPVAYSPDGSRILSGGSDRTVRVWDAKTGGKLREVNMPDRVNSVAYSPDGERIAAACRNARVCVLDVGTNQTKPELFNGHTNDVTSVAISPDSKVIASGSEDHTIRLWDAETGAELDVLRGHRDFVLSVAFSPDGKRVASASEDGTVRIWDATGEWRRE